MARVASLPRYSRVFPPLSHTAEGPAAVTHSALPAVGGKARHSLLLHLL